ncbi:MAG: hypothetical protein AAF515_08925 [Pseudomonadota bacterium]
MKALKVVAIVVGVYALLVIAFETLIGISQPESADTMVIETFDADGTAHPRVVTQIHVDERLYVAVNHWPRAWYRRALAMPAITVSIDGDPEPYLAVPVEGAEFERVNAARPLGPIIKLLTGFPPRRLLRLDPA